jgi:hypothetical protein
VLATPDGPERGGIRFVHAVEPTGDGQIRVDVGDYAPCCGMPADLPQHQWRAYGWTGQRFTQTAGPTAFGPNPKTTDLSVSGSDVALTAQGDSTWRGQVTVRLTNRGPKVLNAGVWIDTPDGITPAGPLPAGCSPVGSHTECRFDAVAVDATRTVTIDLASTVAPAGVVRISAIYTDPTEYPDRTPDDNTRELRITAG